MRSKDQARPRGGLAVVAKVLVAAALLLLGPVAVYAGAAEAAPAPASIRVPDADATDDAAADGGERADAAASSALDERRDDLRALDRRVAAVRTLITGRLPDDLQTDLLFHASIVDDAAVAKRMVELQGSIKQGRIALELNRAELAKRRPDGGGPDAAAPGAGGAADVDAGLTPREAALRTMDADALEVEKLRLDLALDEARLQFLSKPSDFRARVATAVKEQQKAAAAREASEEEERRASEESRLAEEAHKQAVLDAERARGAIERAMANERVRAEDVRRDIAAYRRKLSTRKAELAKQADDRHERVFALVEASRTATAGAEADALYDTILGELGNVRTNVDRAFAEDSAVALPPTFELDPGSLPPPGGLLDADRKELVTLAEQLGTASTTLANEARAVAREQVTRGVARERALDGARLSLLDRLSTDKRDEVLGLGHTGFLQLQLEVWSLKTRARFYRLTMVDTLRGLRAQLSSPAMLGVLITRLLGVVGVIFAVLYVRRRHTSWLTSIRDALPRAVRSARVLRVAFAILDVIASLSHQLLYLGFLWGLHFVLGSALERFEPGWVAYRLAFWLGVYRLVIRSAHRLIARISSAQRAQISVKASDKILFSLRLVGRYAFAVVLLLMSAQAIVGNGYLYRIVLRFAWLGALPIAFVLVRRWRGDIADAYLRYRPDGKLADAVRSTRTRWFGFFVALAAFVAISAAAVTRAGRRFVLGFENSRKILAYVFRKRLERKAADDGPEELPPLPEELARHFSEEPIVDLERAFDHFPEIDTLAAAFERWSRDGNRIGAVLVVGPTGFGKSTWLNKAAARLEGVRVHRARLKDRVTTAPGLIEVIGDAVDAPPEARGSLEALAEHLRLERRAIVIDELQQLVLRGVDTWGAWDALNELVELTGPTVFWTCAMAYYPFKFVRFFRRGADFFRHVVRLPGWTEDDIGELLRQRTAESGFAVGYDDLVVRDVEGIDRAAHLVSTEREYMRLLWDYSDGSPRVALHFWARSLVPDGDLHVRARLFRAPDVDELEKLEEADRFVLACVVWHENVTPEEACISLRYPRNVVEDALGRLTEIGATETTRDAGRYRVSTHWLRATVRFLMRKHLVEP
jgi:hypothetical protein